MRPLGDFIIICGHYGSGKTNLALNLASQRAAMGERVTLCDMDIVNPYFRSSDYPEFIAQHSIELIAPNYAHSNLDLPSIPAEMYSIFSRSGTVIIDVGGDDAGATALGRFSKMIEERGYEMLCVVNRYRSIHPDVEENVTLLREIESASRLRATGIVSNAHLCRETTAQNIREGDAFAREVAERCSLPCEFTCCEKRLLDELEDMADVLYPIDIIVTKPWEI